MLKCSGAHTLSCLFTDCSFAIVGHPDVMCSTVSLNCLQGLHLLSVSVYYYDYYYYEVAAVAVAAAAAAAVVAAAVAAVVVVVPSLIHSFIPLLIQQHCQQYRLSIASGVLN